ncbi:chemotaxis signal transduction protein [Xenococcus sp. PCC 7305]|uniref:chemotaxis protein CheW n=1 Tax=Xenococcus sp. PCC 7305 TaxID=102125 RepID=UPI0002ABC0DF|nr:chemotaxis protein CheW [Xenococcus sp. PCC 7305]ELS02992.1 chemotaxis signal transduction protein [Xenococcus sp. PCC 7305]
MQEYFCAGLSNNIYLGLSLEHVDKLIQFQATDICVIPGIEDFWLGVINYKSSLLWILDIEKLCDPSKNELKTKSEQTALIVNYSMENIQKKVALIVESLEGVVELNSNQEQLSFSTDFPRLQNICDAVIQQNEKVINLVNTEILLEQLSQQSLLSI